LARGKLRRNPDEILSSLQDFENRVQAAQKEFAKINPAEHPDNPKVLEAHEQATRIMEQANQIVSTFKDTINKPIGKTGIGFPPVVKQLPTALRGPVNMVSALSKIPRPAWKMLGSVVGADVGLMLDFMNAICRCIGPVSSKAEIEALRTCCRRFKELQRADPEQAGRCVDVAILGYHMLGICLLSHEDTPLYRYGRPTLELLDESRETLQASADLVQWSFDRELPAGRLWGSNLHASLLWWISKAYIQAGHENMDLKLLQEGVKCLEDAAAMATGARRQQDATFSDAFRILEDKQRFGGNSDITRVYHEGMGAILDSTDYANDPLQKAEVLAACWKWVQRHKAASLSDTLSLNQRVLPSNFKTLENYPNQAELIREEVAILDRLAQDESLDLNVYITLHRDLNAVRMRMEDYPLLQEIIRDRDCDGMDLDNLVSMVLRSGCFNDEIAFIDWVIEPETDEIMITCATCVMGHGKVNITQTTGLTASQVSEWVDQNLNHRVVSNADIAYHRLQDLEPLVRPLKTMTRPGAVLVLCPTMGLRHVPLHAMMIDDEQILLERNPVVYTPSFTVLHHLARIQEDRSGILERTDKQNAVISVYASESPNSPEPKRVTDSLSSLSSRLGTSLQSGAHVSVPFFVSYTHDCDIIHFHGHSVSTSGAETQALVLEPDREDFDTGTRSDVPNSDNNDHHLTARTVLQAISFNRTPLIVNMACSSGKNQFKPGDELFGLTPAFLLAGAATVVGTMWPIRSADGRLFTKHFYGELDKGKDGQGSQSGKRQTVNVARALQQAALRIRDDEATEAPYHWAGFVMSGLWKLKL
jgi:CHAT domain-containing protein